MAVSIEKQQQADGYYHYKARCQEAGYQFDVTGKGETATEADRDFLNNIEEMKNRLDELAQAGKVSA